MEVFHYAAEKLRVYPLFENGNKSIKIKEAQSITTLILNQQSYLVNVLATQLMLKH